MSNKIVNAMRKLPMDSTPKHLLWVISDIADDDGNTSWFAPRARLEEETGFSHTTIAAALKYLVACGALIIQGGKGKQNKYVVTAHNFDASVKYQPKEKEKPVSEVDKLTSKPSVSKQSTRFTTLVNLAEKPVSEVDTIPHSLIYPSIPSIGNSEKPQQKKPKRVTKKQAGINRLVELGCDEKYAHDWMIARKGAQLTDSIIENLEEQSRLAGITLAQAVEWSAKQGYQGFKADWYIRKQGASSGHQAQNRPQTAQEQVKQENAEYWAKRAKRYEQQNTEQGNVIDVTPKKPWIPEEVRHVS